MASASMKCGQAQIRTAYKYGEIDSSLYLSAARAGLPASLVGQMADVFAYDIDFSKVAKGDQFEVDFRGAGCRG